MVKFRLNITYFGLSIILFIIEVFIALFVHDNFIRPYIGDLLVVIFLYSFLLAFVKLPRFKTAIGVLLFAFLIETMQYFKLIYRLKVDDQLWAQLLLGTSFHWLDILAYSIGFLIIIAMEPKIEFRFFKAS